MATFLLWNLTEVEAGKWNLQGYDTSNFPEEPILAVDKTYTTPQEAMDVNGLGFGDVNIVWLAGEKSYQDATGASHSSISKDPVIPTSFAEPLSPQPSNVNFPIISATQAKRIVEGDFTGIRLSAAVNATIDFTATIFRSTGILDGFRQCFGTVQRFYIPGDSGAGTQTFSRDFTQLGKTHCGTRNCLKPVPFAEGPLIGATIVMEGSEVTSSDPIPVELDRDDTTQNCPDGGDPAHEYSTLSSTIEGATDVDVQIGLYRSRSDARVHLYFRAVFQFGPLFIGVYAPVTGSVDFKTIYGFPDPPTSLAVTGDDGLIPITGAEHIGEGECPDNTITTNGVSGGFSLFGVNLQTYGWNYEVVHDGDNREADPLSCCTNVGCQDVGVEQFTVEITELSEL